MRRRVRQQRDGPKWFGGSKASGRRTPKRKSPSKSTATPTRAGSWKSLKNTSPEPHGLSIGSYLASRGVRALHGRRVIPLRSEIECSTTEGPEDRADAASATAFYERRRRGRGVDLPRSDQNFARAPSRTIRNDSETCRTSPRATPTPSNPPSLQIVKIDGFRGVSPRPRGRARPGFFVGRPEADPQEPRAPARGRRGPRTRRAARCTFVAA